MSESAAGEQAAQLKPFLDLCEKASARSRYVLVALIFVSVIMFSGTWKQTTTSWFESNFQVLTQAHTVLSIKASRDERASEIRDCTQIVRFVRETLEEHALIPGVDGSAYPKYFQLDGSSLKCGSVKADVATQVILACAKEEYSRDDRICDSRGKNCSLKDKSTGPNSTSSIFGAAGRSCLDAREMSVRAMTQVAHLQAEIEKADALATSKDFDLGAKLLEKYRRTDSGDVPESVVRERIADELEEARDMRDDYEIVVHLPVFGVVFHINDLGILGGFSIFVLMLWMRASLEEEANGLRITSEQIWKVMQSMVATANAPTPKQKAFLQEMYELMSMQQFFFRPEPFDGIDKESFGSMALRYAVMGLVCLPVFLEFALFYCDLFSDPFIFVRNQGGYIATLVASGAFLALNTMLTYFAVLSANSQVRAWKEIRLKFGSVSRG